MYKLHRLTRFTQREGTEDKYDAEHLDFEEFYDLVAHLKEAYLKDSGTAFELIAEALRAGRSLSHSGFVFRYQRISTRKAVYAVYGEGGLMGRQVYDTEQLAVAAIARHVNADPKTVKARLDALGEYLELWYTRRQVYQIHSYEVICEERT